MSVTALKETTPAPKRPAAEVVRLARPRPPVKTRLRTWLTRAAVNVLPPLVMAVLLLLMWELLCSGPGATLPPPSRIWTDSKDLILDPFFVAGPQDIGLGLRVLVSLQRVAVGFGLAAVVGILIGAVIGQSIWAMRGLDPIFQMLRTVPPLAWLPLALAAFRDSNPSAIFVIFITAIWNQIEFFWKIMLPSAAPYIFTGLRIGIGLSWLAIVAAEMLTGGVGIGFFIWDAWNSSRLPDIIVALVYIGVVGFALDRLVAGIAAFVTRGTASA
ncbi:MAG: nitrate ABC transporter, permease protein [Rhizobiales bacterium 35-66-30]|nr:MAG: nitrate ABC transporter, permease protein [Rhizobiales bacterium 35-66-30]